MDPFIQGPQVYIMFYRQFCSKIKNKIFIYRFKVKWTLNKKQNSSVELALDLQFAFNQVNFLRPENLICSGNSETDQQFYEDHQPLWM